MSEKEFTENHSKLRLEYEKNVKELKKAYAFANSDVKVGDRFTDHIGTIEVTEIGLAQAFSGSLPSCVYTGYVLNKDGRRNKKNELRQSHQSNKKKNL